MKFLFAILLMTGFILSSCSDSSTGTTTDGKYPNLAVYEFDDTKDLVKLVCDAGEMLKKDGESVFTTFMTEDWNNGDKYIFILDLDGKLVFNPNDENNVGNDQSDFEDLGGKKFIRHMKEVVADDPALPYGWTHYQWYRPRSEDTVWKTSFIKKIVADNGKSYLVGSGLYDMQMEKQFVIKQVNSAISLLESDGIEGFATIRDKKNIFVFRNSYVFICKFDGENVVHPMKPEIEGTNILDYTDSNGKKYIQELINLVKSKGSGWVSYLWPKTVGGADENKYTYARKITIENTEYLVAAGMFYD